RANAMALSLYLVILDAIDAVLFSVRDPPPAHGAVTGWSRIIHIMGGLPSGSAAGATFGRDSVPLQPREVLNHIGMVTNIATLPGVGVPPLPSGYSGKAIFSRSASLT